MSTQFFLVVNSFIIVVYENFFQVHSEFLVKGTTKRIFQKTTTKLFMDQSLLNAPPAGCKRNQGKPEVGPVKAAIHRN